VALGLGLGAYLRGAPWNVSKCLGSWLVDTATSGRVAALGAGPPLPIAAGATAPVGLNGVRNKF